ncbi:unnamed protein product [Cylicocyclus nassatus]|uniref:Uncharacterized protein n=1 Tax=Cylicocyclus nassatus TaxID=53992 RepID=A0AA36M565_CYLNA|nr:unnamed protein product [Cylicocyclus nassatus]
MYGLLLAFAIVVSGFFAGQLDHAPAMPLTASRNESNTSLPSLSPDILPSPPLSPIDCVYGHCPEPYTCIAGYCVDDAKRCKFDSDCGRPSFRCVRDVCMQEIIEIGRPRTLEAHF